MSPSKPDPQPLVIPVGTVDITATHVSFVAREKFVVNTSWSAPVKICGLNENFRAWMLEKIEEPFTGSTLKYGTLSRRSNDRQIVEDLGGALQARTSLTEIFQLLKAQKHGGGIGPLLTNGHEIIFYVEDEIRLSEDEEVAYINEAGQNVVLRAVYAYWDLLLNSWGILAFSMLRPYKRYVGCQFFSRNSRLPLSA